jgi:putative FmdB family regulatory protein
MPTYEYTCEKCQKGFECVQSMKDEPFKTCPKEYCQMKKWGKGKVRRLMGTGAGLIFKGSGFYITDYRSEGYKAAAKKDSGDSAPAKKESSDSTPAKKADTKPATPAPKAPAKKD